MSTRINELKKMLQQGESDFLLFAIAKEYELTGSYSMALQGFIYLMNKHPNYAGTYFHLGKLHESTGDWEEAAKIYKQGILICTQQKEDHLLKELKQALMEVETDE